MLQNTTSSAYGSSSDWSASWTIWQQILSSPKCPHWLWGLPTLLFSEFFHRDKAARAWIGGSLDAVLKCCYFKIVISFFGNMIGLSHRILICYELQPVPCLMYCWQEGQITDWFVTVICKPMNFTFLYFWYDVILHSCNHIRTDIFFLGAFTSSQNTLKPWSIIYEGTEERKIIAGNWQSQERH
jgi:hypothetical protein